jgi:hypothetical protein
VATLRVTRPVLTRTPEGNAEDRMDVPHGRRRLVPLAAEAIQHPGHVRGLEPRQPDTADRGPDVPVASLAVVLDRPRAVPGLDGRRQPLRPPVTDRRSDRDLETLRRQNRRLLGAEILEVAFDPSLEDIRRS